MPSGALRPRACQIHLVCFSIHLHSTTPSSALRHKIARSREAIQFNRASDYWLDHAQFDTILQACRQDRSRGSEDPSIRAARLEELVKLYR